MTAATAGAVRVLSPSAMHSSLEAIVEAHHARTGDEVTLTFETAPTLVQRIAEGEISDVIVAPPGVMDQLIAAGVANRESRLLLGRAGVGIAVRDGAPLPDASTSTALKAALLQADSIVHTLASSGLYVARMFERLGIAEQIAAKTARYHDAVGAFTHLKNGAGREIGFGGIPEIRRWHDQGLRFVGPLPQDLQNYTTYIAALALDAPNAEGARRFLHFLGSPEAKALCLANGID